MIDLLVRELVSTSLFFLRLVPSNTLMDRIIRDPKVMGGKPVVKGTRVTMETILRRLASGLSVEDLLKEYPQLTEEDVRAALEYAARMLEEEGIEIEDEVLS